MRKLTKEYNDICRSLGYEPNEIEIEDVWSGVEFRLNEDGDLSGWRLHLTVNIKVTDD